MSCCGDSALADLHARDLTVLTEELPGGRRHLELLVPAARCGACIAAIEGAVGALPGVESARLNLSTKRLATVWSGSLDPTDIAAALASCGFDWSPLSVDTADAAHAREAGELIRALAVAGFAAANVMLLSVSVWSGAEGSTRELFHWLSAAIALPAIAYAIRPFARSALAALRARRTNMDVPITLAVCLAAAMSVHEAALGEPHVYFDASVSLLFFLLLGRTLDHAVRARARAAAAQLLAQSARAVSVVGADGTLAWKATDDVAVGERVRVAAGERIALDGRIVTGAGTVDASIVSGESAPVRVGPGDTVLSGSVNLSAPLEMAVTAASGDGFLAKMAALIESADVKRARYVRLADRASRLYAPVVHAIALLGFLGWWLAGAGVHDALMVAIATLIITCPCALGLAVPAVGTVASNVLFREGILLKDGAALERLAGIETVVFDKTGTLTRGRPHVEGDGEPRALALAAALAGHSRHPLSAALAASFRPAEKPAFTNVVEHAGCGLSADLATHGRVHTVRLGRSGWAVPETDDAERDATTLVLSIDGRAAATFRFADAVRPGAAEAVRHLGAAGARCVILSGDRAGPVRHLAQAVGIDRWSARCSPQEKVAAIETLQAAGPVLAVGDGLNDGPALRAADVGMAPANASDLGRASADIVFLRDSLAAVPFALQVARTAMRHVRQNFALALGYNALAVPLALSGHVTPLVAALAMSSSSILVVLNALRLTLCVNGAARRAAPRSGRTVAATGAQAAA